MKKITLTNPEEAQVLFHLNEWLYLPSYSIHGIKIDEEVCIVNANEFNSKVIAEEIKVILGAYEYIIKLDDFPNEVNISFKDVTDIGALLEINYEPYFLRVYNNANEQNLNEIVEKLPRLKIIDFGSGKNESIKSLHTFTSCVELIEINLANCKQLIDISDIVHFKYLQRLNIDGFQDELQLKTINSLDYIQKISNKRNAKISLKNVEQANNIFQVFTAHDNDYSFYIKAVHFDESESTILDLNEFTEETVGTHIFVKIGFQDFY